jgi:ribosomal protein L18
MSKSSASIKLSAKERRTYRTRNKIRRVNLDRVGVRETRPRLSVHRSDRQIYAQVICDIRGITIKKFAKASKQVATKVLLSRLVNLLHNAQRRLVYRRSYLIVVLISITDASRLLPTVRVPVVWNFRKRT